MRTCKKCGHKQNDHAEVEYSDGTLWECAAIVYGHIECDCIALYNEFTKEPNVTA